MVNIEQLKSEDCGPVSDLHLKYFQHQFHDLPGRRLLECYYKGVANQVGSTGFVAKNDEKVIGYICGVWDKGAINAFLKHKYIASLILWGFLHVVTHPSTLSKMVNKVTQGSELIKKEGYELRPIIVDKDFRGSGVADLLVDRLILDAQERGYTSIFLIAEMENERAKSFYIKMNFQHLKDFENNSHQYCLFEKQI